MGGVTENLVLAVMGGRATGVVYLAAGTAPGCGVPGAPFTMPGPAGRGTPPGPGDMEVGGMAPLTPAAGGGYMGTVVPGWTAPTCFTLGAVWAPGVP